MEYFGAAFSCNVLYFSMFCHCRPDNGGLYCTGRRTRYKSCNNKVRSGYGSPNSFSCLLPIDKMQVLCCFNDLEVHKSQRPDNNNLCVNDLP